MFYFLAKRIKKVLFQILISTKPDKVDTRERLKVRKVRKKKNTKPAK